MPIYVMQSTILPRSICDEIDKLCRGFIWGDDDQQRKVHLLSWGKICKPKENGGLGFRSTRIANSALIMKAIWNLCTKPEDLWCTIIRKKYKCGWSDFPSVDKKRKGSNFWNGIAGSWETFRNNLC